MLDIDLEVTESEIERNWYIQHRHRFPIFKKVGVKFYDLFLWGEWLQRNFSYFIVNLPLDFSEIFNIFRISVFFFFFKNSGKFSKKQNCRNF